MFFVVKVCLLFLFVSWLIWFFCIFIIVNFDVMKKLEIRISIKMRKIFNMFKCVFYFKVWNKDVIFCNYVIFL